MNKSVYICPSCGSVYILEEKGRCRNCGTDLIPMQISERKWNSMSRSKQQRTVEWYLKTYSASYSGKSGWVSFLRTLSIIQIVLGCIVSVVLGVTLGALLGGVAGFAIALVGFLLSFGSAAMTMVFLDIAADIRSIRNIASDIFDGLDNSELPQENTEMTADLESRVRAALDKR